MKPGNWIEWHGGARPVSWDTLVEVKTRDGITNSAVKAGLWGTDADDADLSSWSWTPDHKSGGDIIAYRVVLA
jgi:hypothetical protein